MKPTPLVALLREPRQARPLAALLASAALGLPVAGILALSGCSSNPSGPSDGDEVYESYLVDLTGAGDYLTIQEGLNAAGDGDTVYVAPGTYTGPGNRDLEFGGSGIVLKGTAARDETVIDCEGAGRGFYISGGAAPVIENLMVTNGDADEGGGMYVRGVSPALVNVRFVANHATDGGGLFCENASPALADVLFDDNTAASGGGAMHCQHSSPALSRVEFINNAAPGSGGGMTCIFSSPAISECVFRKNSAFFGGGIYCADSSPSVTSCTFADNEAAHGGGLYCFGGSDPAITNTIIAFSSGSTALFCGAGSEPFTSHSCFYGNDGGDEVCGPHSTSMLYTDPLFCDLEAGDLTLRGDSDCLPDNNQWDILIGALGEGCE